MSDRITSRERRIKQLLGPKADAAYETCKAEVQEENGRNLVSRRGFVKLVSATAVAAAAGISLAGCSGVNEFVTGEKDIVDDAGRSLTIPAPDTIKSVYFTSGLAEVFVFTLNPDLLAGTSSMYSAEKLELMPDRMGDLEYYGSISGGGSIDTEALMDAGVQIIFSISGIGLTAANESDAIRLQEQTNIPVVLIDGSFDKIAHAYRFLGECIGEDSRADTIGKYCEDKYAEVSSAVSSLQDSDKITLYYAEGPEGVWTEPSNSQHALAFNIAGAKDVAEVELGGALGMTPVNIEQILLWNPEVIVAWPTDFGGADDDIRSNSRWSQITAVKTNRVYSMPYVPFAWCDRPPGINRLIGIQWIANLLYPQLYDIDMVQVTKDFYSEMYWVDITDDKAKELLGNSYPPDSWKS